MRYLNNVAPLIVNVPKFNGTNYHDFRAGISVVLLKEGVWDVVDGSTPRPVLDAKIKDEKEVQYIKAQMEEWDRASTSAKATILLCMDTNYQHRVPESATAPEVWISLHHRYGTVSRARKCQYRAAFWNASHSSSLNIDTFINDVCLAARRLNQIGITISESDISEVLVFNLDASWQSVKSALMALPVLSLSEVETQLTNHQHQLDGLPGQEPSVIAAANAVRQRKCFLCDDTDHMFDKCPLKDAFKKFIKKSKGKGKVSAHQAKLDEMFAVLGSDSE